MSTAKPRARSSGASAHHDPGPVSGLCSNTSFTAIAWRLRSGIHAVEEVRVVLGRSELVEQELDRIGCSHRRQDAAQDMRLGQGALVEQQLVLARAGLEDVDRWIDALVGDLAVEHDFR